LQIGTPAYDSEQRESAEAASRPVEPGGQVHLAKPASRGLGPQPRDQATRVPRAERVTGTARTATG